MMSPASGNDRKKKRKRPQVLECAIVFYSGYRTEETPRAIRCRGREIPVQKVLGRKRRMDAASGVTLEEFVCKVGGEEVRLRPQGEGTWLLLVSPESLLFRKTK